VFCLQIDNFTYNGLKLQKEDLTPTGKFTWLSIQYRMGDFPGVEVLRLVAIMEASLTIAACLLAQRG